MIVRFYDSSDSTILPSETLEMIVRFSDSSDSTILPQGTLRTRYIHVHAFGAFVLAHGLKNEVYSCVARLFWLMD